jgi:hypothetical protein
MRDNDLHHASTSSEARDVDPTRRSFCFRRFSNCRGRKKNLIQASQTAGERSSAKGRDGSPAIFVLFTNISVILTCQIARLNPIYSELYRATLQYDIDRRLIDFLIISPFLFGFRIGLACTALWSP